MSLLRRIHQDIRVQEELRKAATILSRNSQNVFHLAIPCSNLARAEHSYSKLGCRIARRYDDRITLDFFGDQVVCHLSPELIDRQPRMYPRHFGITFRDERSYTQLLDHCRKRGLQFLKDPFVRFQGLREEHRTFFLVDPSNNVLEFKYYQDPLMMY